MACSVALGMLILFASQKIDRCARRVRQRDAASVPGWHDCLARWAACQYLLDFDPALSSTKNCPTTARRVAGVPLGYPTYGPALAECRRAPAFLRLRGASQPPWRWR